MMNYLTSNNKYLVFFLLALSTGVLATSASVDSAIEKFAKNQPDVKIKIVSYGQSKKHCQSELQIKSKLPIKPSSRWIFKVICPNKWRANISAKTKVLHRRYIALKDIYKGDKISIGSVKFNEVWSDKIGTNYIDVLGKIAKNKISKGITIKPYNLEKNFLIKKKQRIDVVLNSKSLRLKITAMTLEPGNIYDIIEVINLKSKKKLLVKIISRTEAILE